MNGRPIIEEQYVKGDDVINYVVYKSRTGAGNDEVLQHKINGITESAHITLHPDGKVNLRIKRTETYLKKAVKNNLLGYSPRISKNVKQFLSIVRSKILRIWGVRGVGAAFLPRLSRQECRSHIIYPPVLSWHDMN